MSARCVRVCDSNMRACVNANMRSRCAVIHVGIIACKHVSRSCVRRGFNINQKYQHEQGGGDKTNKRIQNKQTLKSRQNKQG